MLARCSFLLMLAWLAQGQSTSPSDSSVSSGTQQPLTAGERFQWITLSTIGPQGLAGGLISAGWGTLFNVPREYGPHWEGYGKRYGMRLTGIATSNVMEAGLGALWGEDPRYVRSSSETFKGRLGHVFKMTFMAENSRGGVSPAYARFLAIPGSNYLSNTWRADSEATWQRASIRIGFGFLGRLAGNAFDEFWPDVRRRVFDRSGQGTRAAHGD